MATYVSSPPTQSGVANTRTNITKSFTFYSGGFFEVDYEVSSEGGFDFFRIILNGTTMVEDSGTGVGPQTSPQIFTSPGSFPLRFEYEKDGSTDDGTDNVVVTQIRIYNGSSVLQETHNFSGTNGTGPPTGWTERLNDGGVTVTGSHWTLTDTGGGGVSGTIASTTTKPTLAAAGTQTHLGAIASTTTRPTVAAAGAQTHLGVIGTTTTAPAFAASGTVGSPGVAATVASTTTAPTFAAVGTQTHVGVFSATTAMPVFAAEATNVDPIPPSATGVFVRNAGATRADLGSHDFQARIEVDRGSTARIQPTSSYTAQLPEE